MYTTVQDSDRVVLRYEVPADETGRISESVFLLVHDINITGEYVILFSGELFGLTVPANTFELMWKGNIATCLDRLCTELIEWEHDAGLAKK